jgi:hypothetical protein
MKETYFKGKDPNKIYEAFVNGIDQSDYRQLAITGRYKYKGYTNEQLTEVLQESNDEYTNLANTRKLDLQQTLNKIDKALPGTKNPEDKKTLEDQRVKVVQAMSKLDEQVAESNTTFNESKEKLATGDEDYTNQVRSRIHTNKFLSTLSKDFADKNSYVKYAENPLWKAMMEEKKLAAEWAKAAAANRQAAAAEKTAAAYEEKSASVVRGYDTEIKLAELAGEDTRKAEIKKAYWILNTAKARAEADIKAYQSAKLAGELDEEELKDLEKKYKASVEGAKQAQDDIKILKATFAAEDKAAREKELEKITADHVAKIDELLKHKEVELLEV